MKDYIKNFIYFKMKVNNNKIDSVFIKFILELLIPQERKKINFLKNKIYNYIIDNIYNYNFGLNHSFFSERHRKIIIFYGFQLIF